MDGWMDPNFVSGVVCVLRWSPETIHYPHPVVAGNTSYT